MRTGIIIVPLAVAGVLTLACAFTRTDAPDVSVYTSATCGCCEQWVAHLRQAGFEVHHRSTAEMPAVKKALGIDEELFSCHTAVVDGYVLEGHVPSREIRKLLSERPAITGLAVPGLPMGAPGVEGPYQQPFDVLAFDHTGKVAVFASYR